MTRLRQQLESAATETCRLLHVCTSSPGESSTLFRDFDHGRVLGCCHVFSTLGVSPAAWQKR